MLDLNHPIARRNTDWTRQLAGVLARSALDPNQLSRLSVLFALLGSTALLAWPGPAGLLTCAAFIVLRLLCNLLDGMVAVEGGRGTATGPLYNEIPDRIADGMFLVALGYAVAVPWLGWLAALLAIMTAYVRALGGTLGQVQEFRGPMARPHRMWLLVLALLAATVFVATGRQILLVSAIIIVLGSAVTCIKRMRAIAVRLQTAERT